MHKIPAALLFCSLLGVSASAHAAAYKLDPDHTSITFKIRHLLSWVSGSFDQFEGTFEYEPGKPELWKANAVIQAASIDTGVQQRDEHLRKKDFFEVETYPTIAFESTKAAAVSETAARVEGNLTIHGVTRPVVLDVEILGEAKDPWGNEMAGFTATTTINRKDFGLTWNQAVEAGQFLVGDEVKITIEVTGIKQTE